MLYAGEKATVARLRVERVEPFGRSQNQSAVSPQCDGADLDTNVVHVVDPRRRIEVM